MGVPIVFIALLLGTVAHAQNGIVTIFREKPTSRLKMFSQQDQFPVRLHLKMTLDGEPLVDMHGGEWVSYSVAAGRHSIQFYKNGAATADFELHPGERVFVRPGFTGNQFFEAAKFTLRVVSCKEANTEASVGIEPMPDKYLERTEPLKETVFPQCE